MDCTFEEELSKKISEEDEQTSFFLQTDIRAFLYDGQVHEEEKRREEGGSEQGGLYFSIILFVYACYDSIKLLSQWKEGGKLIQEMWKE